MRVTLINEKVKKGVQLNVLIRTSCIFIYKPTDDDLLKLINETLCIGLINIFKIEKKNISKRITPKKTFSYYFVLQQKNVLPRQ